MASLTSLEELRAFESRLKDRYGPIPRPARNLIKVTRLRFEATMASVETVEIRGDRLMVQRNGGFLMVNNRQFPRLRSKHPSSMLSEAIEWLESLNRP